MKVVFIGDSLTSGENNNFKSFAHYLSEYVQNEAEISIYGVSGACFENYSIFPVKENLFDFIEKNKKILKGTDKLFIEFGINDTASIVTGYVDLKKVYISINKIIDDIIQIDPNINIIFLLPLKYRKSKIIFSRNYVDYLNKEYLISGFKKIHFLSFLFIYNKIERFIRRNFQLLFLEEKDRLFIDHLDSDNIHPTDNGYQKIAENLLSKGCLL